MRPSESVYVFRSRLNITGTPVFHRYGRRSGVTVFTDCGYTMRRYGGVNGGWLVYTIPHRHARKFAFPCAKCFPNGKP